MAGTIRSLETPEQPTYIGPYRVQIELSNSERSMYIGGDDNGRTVFLKGIRRYLDEGRALLMHERAVLVALNNPELHPNLLHLSDYRPNPLSTPDGRPFLVLTYAGGRTLEQMYGRSLEFRGVALAQALQGLEFIHDRGIVHDDLKPGNILVNGTAKLIDFENADWYKSRIHPLTDNRWVDLITPEWASPERLNNGKRPTPESDTYSMGFIVIAALRGSDQPLPYELKRTREECKVKFEIDRKAPLIRESDVKPFGELGYYAFKAISPEPEKRPPLSQLREIALAQYGDRFPEESLDGIVHIRSTPESPIISRVSSGYRKVGPPLEGRVYPA